MNCIICDMQILLECNGVSTLNHLPLDKMARNWQMTFSNAFSWMKSFVFWIKFNLHLFLVQLIVGQYWFRWWLGAEQATSHYLNQHWPSSLTHICDTRGRWVNSLWSSDIIWWHKLSSSWAQVKACCLTTPSHYMNQCWFAINAIFWHSCQGNVYLNTH